MTECAWAGCPLPVDADTFELCTGHTEIVGGIMTVEAERMELDFAPVVDATTEPNVDKDPRMTDEPTRVLAERIVTELVIDPRQALALARVLKREGWTAPPTELYTVGPAVLDAIAHAQWCVDEELPLESARLRLLVDALTEAHLDLAALTGHPTRIVPRSRP